MSQSSQGGDGDATSTNPRGHRPGETKHGGASSVANNSDDVFLVPQPPVTPTKKHNGILGFIDRYSRSPARKRRTASNDASFNRTATVVQPSSRSPSVSSDMDTTDSSSTIRAYTAQPPVGLSQPLPNEVAATGKVSEVKLIEALTNCIQMAANYTTSDADHTDFSPSKEIMAAFRTLGLILELDPSSSPTVLENALELEGVNESMHAPKKNNLPANSPADDTRRIALLETAVADIATKFSELTRAILQGQIPSANDTSTHKGVGTPAWGQQPPDPNPGSSFATGPTYKPTAKPKAIPSFTSRHHESRLIINITPTPSREEQAEHSGPRIRDAINQRLRTNEDTNHMLIALVSWSNLGSAIINTADGLTAADLEPHASIFTDLLPHTPGATFVTQTDSPWFKVTLNGVSTRGGSYFYANDGMEHDLSTVPNSKTLLKELLDYNGWLRERKIIGEPRWIAAPETLMSRNKSSVVIAFAKKEDANELVKRRGVFMFGHRASTRTYIDIPPLRHCTNCWKLDHTSILCKEKPRCRLCAGEHATEDHNCGLCDAIGSSCEHTVVKCTHCPDSDSPHYADSFACPYRRAYKGVVIAAPRMRGGRKFKKKPKPKNVMLEATPPPPPPPAPPRPIPTDPTLREAIRLSAKLGVPSATDQQIQDALNATDYDLTATFSALLKAVTRTMPDTSQPDIPPR